VKGGPDDKISMSRLYAYYKEYMFSNGYPAKGSSRFYSAVESYIPGLVRSRAWVEKDEKRYTTDVFVGLRQKGEGKK
jgi:hypothetical protein